MKRFFRYTSNLEKINKKKQNMTKVFFFGYQDNGTIKNQTKNAQFLDEAVMKKERNIAVTTKTIATLF